MTFHKRKLSTNKKTTKQKTNKMQITFQDLFSSI